MIREKREKIKENNKNGQADNIDSGLANTGTDDAHKIDEGTGFGGGVGETDELGGLGMDTGAEPADNLFNRKIVEKDKEEKE